ncbi:MAG: hypothetical protein HC819_22360 [Cyclobacteriaceae bacterium]|nr:hypothetical protein [Cyclobacteriaceae bacterium]
MNDGMKGKERLFSEAFYLVPQLGGEYREGYFGQGKKACFLKPRSVSYLTTI